MHTLELLLDAGLEGEVRALWRRLSEAGLPSLQRHRHPTNRPHLTLLRASSLAGLPALALPLEVRLGPVRMLGRALVRGVVPSAGLLEVQSRAFAALEGAERWPPPDAFVPHVSLALRVPERDQAVALRLLADVPPSRGMFTAARIYDTEARTVSDWAAAVRSDG